jgi:hypothetical protein
MIAFSASMAWVRAFTAVSRATLAQLQHLDFASS